MAQFTVRDFDDELYKKLKERAKSNHRSLEAEVRVTLLRGLSRPERSLAERQESIRQIDAIRNSIDYSKLADFDVLDALREDRDRDN